MKYVFGNILKLFKVTCWHDNELKNTTFVNIVVAGNKVEAKRIVEEEIWTLGGMGIKSIEEIDLHYPQFILSANSDDIE